MAAVCINAWYKYRQSLDWQFGFNLSEQGHGHLLDGRIIEFKYRLLITKICLIAIIKVQQQPWQLLVIWGDMLPKPYYHLLSRIICQLKV
ncbi:hypothetical protein [Paraferrimonas sp. SM1919]|uniref:hypothetical protein n=1 Tax=Paraferrimonas sp. SM1919 TaxID=2662263 RepID=UPI0013D418A9|nr:hypothetical protein [Paraferrimonas sp. SM1919]